MKLESFKQLIVWRKSIELVKEIYQATSLLPRNETYGLASQMRRAAVSIPSNIAEGYKRKNRGEYVQFLSIANASAAELETQVIITKEIYPKIKLSAVINLLEEVQKMLNAMIARLHPTPYTLHPHVA